MAQYLGQVQGQRGQATRLGSAKSGLDVTAASWQGAVAVRLYEKDGVDMARVMLTTWHGAGTNRVLYDGPVGGGPIAEPEQEPCSYCEGGALFGDCLKCGGTGKKEVSHA